MGKFTHIVLTRTGGTNPGKTVFFNAVIPGTVGFFVLIANIINFISASPYSNTYSKFYLITPMLIRTSGNGLAVNMDTTVR